jgi:hypothetical protein
MRTAGTKKKKWTEHETKKIFFEPKHRKTEKPKNQKTKKPKNQKTKKPKRQK